MSPERMGQQAPASAQAALGAGFAAVAQEPLADAPHSPQRDSAGGAPVSARDHAHRIVNAVQHGLRDHTTDVVAASWARCLNEYGLDPVQTRRPPVLARNEFEARRSRMADVIDCARYEMSTLYQQLGDPESAVVLTDAQGLILHMQASPDFERRVQPLGLELGALWSEAEAGTNGMGTCARAASPVAICQEDHFLAQFSRLTCAAVPVYDPSGEMTAVLDVSSGSQMPQQHLLLLLGMTARMIENRLMDMRFPEAHPIHFHSRPEFVYTLHEGKLIVDDEGRVLSANRSALFQLGLPTIGEIRKRRLEQIFQTTLPGMLERSHQASFHPVVTYRTDAAHRFFAVAREPARSAGAGLGQPGLGTQHHGADSAPLARAVGAAMAAQQARRGAAPLRTPLPAARGATPSAGVASGAAGGLMASSAFNASSANGAALVQRPLLAGMGRATLGDPRLQAHLSAGVRVIARGTPLLLRGETGSGKEVLARAVHAGSPRADGPFVAVNCASLPEQLIEAELFGYRAGAFTGAERSGRRGRIAQSDGGTLFLDEIGDMPLALQARLLRVLDERTVTPLGTDDARPVDFQLISASHRQLLRLVSEGTFREDLYFRLSGIEFELPALRERSDRAQLIRDVLSDEGCPDAEIDASAWDLLMNHRWPGNVRQLRHAVRSALALADGATLALAHFPGLTKGGASILTTAGPLVMTALPTLPAGLHEGTGLLGGSGAIGTAGVFAASGSASASALAGFPPVGASVPSDRTNRIDHTDDVPDMAAEDAQARQQLIELLGSVRWNVSHAAKALSVSRNTLYRRMHKLRIAVTHPQ